MKKSISVLLVIMSALLLVACGGGEKEKGKSGKEMVFNNYLGAEPNTLDAQKGSDMYSGAVLNNAMEPLVRLVENDDKSVRIEEAGAESYEVSEDKRVYTFVIRKHEWSDGQKVTAEDYVYGIKRSVDPETAAEMGFLLGPIKNANAIIAGEKKIDELGVKALDDTTLEVTLEEPAEYFIKVATQRIMFPQRKDIVEKHGEQFGSEKDKFIGNGPFLIEDWTHNSELKLVKSDTYWDKDKVKLDRVSLKILADENTINNSFETGELDSVIVSKAQWRDKFKEKNGVTHQSITRPAVNYIAFNTEDKYFKNEKIRRAFQLGVNREELANTVHDGILTPAYGWVAPTINVGEIDYRANAEEPLLAIAKESDPKKLLAEGLKELGITESPDKLDFTLSFGVTSQFMRTLGEFVQSSYKENLGVNVKLDFNEWPIFSGKMNKGDYQFGYLAWTADFDDPYAMLSVVLSNAGNINTGWVNEEYDRLVKEGSQEGDPQKAIELYHQAEEILMSDGIISPLVYATTEMFYYDYVKNLATNQFATQGYKYIDTSGR